MPTRRSTANRRRYHEKPDTDATKQPSPNLVRLLPHYAIRSVGLSLGSAPSYAEGQFVRSGFHLYVTVQLHDEPGKVVVRLRNNSNVKVSKLPVPPDARFVGVDYNTASYETSVGVEETKEAVRKLLTEHGWKVLGWRGNRLVLQQNAVELSSRKRTVGEPEGQPCEVNCRNLSNTSP